MASNNYTFSNTLQTNTYGSYARYVNMTIQRKYSNNVLGPNVSFVYDMHTPFLVQNTAPTLWADFSRNQFILNGSYVNDTSIITRNGQAKVVVGANGALQNVSSNTLAYDYSSGRRKLLCEGQSINYFRNNTMAGTVNGSPGTVPTNWGIVSSTNGLTRTIIGTGTENGVDYIDIRYNGTATADTTINIRAENSVTFIAGASGQTWTHSAYISVISGTIPNAFYIRMLGFNSSGTQLENTDVSISLNSTLKRYSVTRTLNNASTAYVDGALLTTIFNGNSVDFTIRIGLPQLEQSTRASSIIRTSSAQVTRTTDILPFTNAAVATFVSAGPCTVSLKAAGAVISYAWLLSISAKELFRRSTSNNGSQILGVVPLAQGSGLGITDVNSSPFGISIGWNSAGGIGSSSNGNTSINTATPNGAITSAYIGSSGGITGWIDVDEVLT
jgi:hypothetical protein